MMTKRQYCEMIVDQAIRKKDLIPECVYGPTSLGIALEYLGFINPKDTPDLYNYLQSCGGVIFMHYDNKIGGSAFLSMRELLELLPYDNENKGE